MILYFLKYWAVNNLSLISSECEFQHLGWVIFLSLLSFPCLHYSSSQWKRQVFMVITHIPLLELYLSKLHFPSITNFILLWLVYNE